MNTIAYTTRTRGLLLVACLSLAFLSGCGKVVKRGYTNPSASVTQVRTIAILPFDGVSEADVAADMISMVLAKDNVFENIVDRAQITSTLNEHNLPAELLDANTTIGKGRFVNADAMLKGRVTRFDQGRPAYPVATATFIAMSLKLVSSETGKIIWTQLYTRKSAGRGVFAPNVDEMMIDMAEEIAGDLINLKL